MAMRFEENSNNLTGSKTRSTTPLSPLTQLRMQAQAQIAANAAAAGVPIDQIVTQTLYSGLSHLQTYVQSKGETPLQDPTALCMQAALLRANDIATVAGVLKSTDEDALQSIEGAESEYVKDNTPDASNVLPPALSAAIVEALTYASQCHPGDGSMKSLLSDLNNTAAAVRTKLKKSGAPSNFGTDANNVSDPGTYDDTSYDWDSWLTDSNPDLTSALGQTSPGTSSIGSTLATIPVTGGVSAGGVAGLFPTISNSASNLPAAGGNASGGVLNGLGSVIGSITSLFGGITQAGNAAAAAGGSINNAISNIGANSISAFISQNKGTILFVIAIIIVLIVAITYARRK